MRRRILVLFAVLMGMSFSGCQSSETDTANVDNSNDSQTGWEVDEGLLLTGITFPASLYEGMTEEEIKEIAKENGYLSCDIAEDGSVTNVMTKSKQKELADGLKDSMETMVEELINGKDKIESFQKIEYDENMTEFNVYVDREKYSGWDSIAYMGFYYIGGIYQIFVGIPSEETNVVVNTIDFQTNEIIESNSSKKFSEENSDAA